MLASKVAGFSQRQVISVSLISPSRSLVVTWQRLSVAERATQASDRVHEAAEDPVAPGDDAEVVRVAEPLVRVAEAEAEADLVPEAEPLI